ncbi:MAG: HD domain-containing protein [Sedimentisphaerales bacterium]|nr:HD domain-containing protein [Sedimentisphaerales bacterium]
MAHKFINKVEAGETINDIYLVKDPILRSTTRGDLYIAMFLCDRSGQINGRMWQATEIIYKSIPKPGFVHIQGRSELYQNNLQVIVNKITQIDSSKVNIDDFLPKTKKNVEKMFEEVKQIISQIKNPQLKAIVDSFLNDEERMEKFISSPGGMKLHHSCIGGLLEHVHNMLCVANAILPMYPNVQPDLVLAGIFLHDMGKTEELSYDLSFSYTNQGQLLGHIVQSVLMINDKISLLKSGGTDFDQQIIDSLEHIIVSHHGQYEYGSPKLPAMTEAFMVCFIDDLDAKINMVESAIAEEDGDENWTAWKNALQTRLYKKRLE